MNDQSQLLSNSSNHGTTSSENIRPKGLSGKRASVHVLLKGSESVVSNAAGEGIIGVLSSSSPSPSPSPSPSSSSSSSPPSAAPCGACKFLRRKCINGCIFAPHFGSDQGAARFAAVHKVFGASNVSKILLHIPENRRNDAVVTISYEAQARLTDPVYGCVSTILALQQQVASLQAELAMVQTQLMNSRYAMANVLQDSQVIQQQQNQIAALQPAYSNTSSASNNLININSCNSNFEFAGEVAPPSSNSFDPPIHISQIPQEVEEDDEEESQNPLDFTTQIFQQDDKTFF